MISPNQQAVEPASLLGAIDRDQMLQLLEDLVAVPSPTAGEGELVARLANKLGDAGFDDIFVDEHHNLLLTIEGAEPGPTRLLLTHTDTAGGAAAMQDPFKARRESGAPLGKEGEVVRGSGTVAPKSHIAAMVAALRALRAVGLPRHGRVLLAAVTKDMQANHAGLKELLASRSFVADWAVASEPSSSQLALGARGINQLGVRLTGKPTHWGRPTEGVNPLFALGDVLRALETSEMPRDPVLGLATIAPFEVTSDAAPPQTPINVDLLLDRRTLPGESSEAVLAGLRALVDAVAAERPGLAASVELRRVMHSFSADPASPLVRAIQTAAVQAFGAELPTMYLPFGSNAGYAVTELGWPAVAFGPGNIGDLGANEHVEIQQVERAAQVYAAMLAYVDPSVS